MESYILRLYRRGDDDSPSIAGLLEDVAAGSQSAFHSFEELRELLLCDVDEKAGDLSRPKAPG